MISHKLYLAIIIGIALSYNANSQTGPGGIGSSDGTSDLIMWLRADLGVESSSGVSAVNNDNITTWVDQSGDGNDATSVRAPSYETGKQNGYPAIHFTESNNEYLNIDNEQNLPSGGNDRTYLFAAEPSNPATGTQTLLYHGHTTETLANYGQRINITNNTNEFSVSVSGKRFGVQPGFSSFNIGTIIFPSAGSTSNDFLNYNNGGLLTSYVVDGDNSFGAININTTNELAYIGANRVASQHYNGDMSEIIIFDKELSDLEFNIVNNYLSAKYGTTLDSTIDLYTQDDAANGDFDHNVAGIGRINASDIHNDSKGTGIVRISNPRNLGNGEYLFWGEDTKDAVYNFSTNTSLYYEHLNSNWRVNEIGNVGGVNVSFDITNMDLTGYISCGTLQLVVDNNSDYSSPTVYDLTISGSTASNNRVNFSDGDYFSIRYLDQIVWDGTQFYNGSGTANAPDTSDDCLKLTILSTTPGALTFDAHVREVEVESGATLNVTDGLLLEVEEEVVIDGTLDLLGEAQLIQNHTNVTSNSGSGNLRIRQQGTSNLYNYNYWSAPVNTGSGYWQIGSLEDANGVIDFSSDPDADPTTSPITLSSRWLYQFNGLTGTYSEWSALTTTSNLLPGIGYIMKGSGTSDAEQEYIFSGTPNDGNYTISATAGNDILVGNPYPSALNADQFIIDNLFIIDGTLSFWEHFSTNNSHVLADYQGGYATYNLLMSLVAAATADTSGLTSGLGLSFKSAPSSNIAVGQGYFLTINTTGNIEFNNQQRIFSKESDATDAPVFYRSANSSTDLRPKIWFSFTDPNNLKTTIGLGYDSDNATKEYDNGYDAKLFGTKNNDIYWVLNDENLIIQALANINIEDELPLTIKATDAGIYKIAIDKTENVPTDTNIFLKDNLTNTYYSLNTDDSELVLQNDIYENRFSIVFKEDTTLSTDDFQNSPISVYYDRTTKDLSILNYENLSSIKSLIIYNVTGQKIINLNTLQSDTINLNKFSDGIYIVNITSETNQNKVIKFVKF
ncbi:T9SS type A sorting domain-containing protein [Formosa algae]|uniref:DUF8202 domain-containing protein n=1 Tax=Formosa algae TaxID=225843 RepID=A0A9X1CA22_9FLAO|nr:T9SS type A sorting domain-containing protein [Formosa algae]MBP1841323.1 hypothetical protein [Formosa algae]MDQ0336755.1 hypothetical protein [Formosa algae]OEI80045.1 hypothetical protein AST99_11370 [Formosa algae]